jgi:hypothetical protein
VESEPLMNSNLIGMKNLKSVVKKLIGSKYSFAVVGSLNKIKNKYFDILIFINCRSNTKIMSYECKKLNFLDEISPIFCFASAELGVNKSPEYVRGNFETLSRKVPAVNLYELKNCIFTITSSNFLSDETLLVDRIIDIPMSISDYSTGFLKRHNEVCGLININKKIDGLKIKSAYFLGGNGSWNYYHWMTEILPKLKYIATDPGYDRCQNLVVSSKVSITDSFKKTIQAAIINYGFEIHFLEPAKIYHIENLFVVSNPSNVLFNAKMENPKITFSYLRKNSIDYVRAIGLNLVDKNISAQRSDNVFIARKYGSARPYNQSEIEFLLAQEFGFKVIYFDELSIEDQVKIFSGANIIVGPSGAAWTNLVFCNKNVTLLSWLPVNAKEFSVYSSMAYNYNLRMIFLQATPDFKDQLHTSYKVSLEELRSCMRYLINDNEVPPKQRF